MTPNKIVEIAAADNKKYIRELLDSSCQGVNRLFVLAYDNTAGNNNQVSADSYKKYFLPRVTTISKLMEEIFMINQLMIQLNNMMKLERYQQEKVMITLQVVY